MSASSDRDPRFDQLWRRQSSWKYVFFFFFFFFFGCTLPYLVQGSWKPRLSITGHHQVYGAIRDRRNDTHMFWWSKPVASQANPYSQHSSYILWFGVSAAEHWFGVGNFIWCTLSLLSCVLNPSEPERSITDSLSLGIKTMLLLPERRPMANGEHHHRKRK